MKEIFQKFKLPIIVIAFLFVGLFIYNSFMKSPEPVGTLSSGVKGDGSAVPGADFLPLLLRIKDVSFDQKFFSDPVYKKLMDDSQTIIPESKGKDNPFAPGIFGSSSSTVESLGFQDTTNLNAGATSSSAGARR